MVNWLQGSRVRKVNDIWYLFSAVYGAFIQFISCLVHCMIYVVIEWHEQGIICPKLCVMKRMEPASKGWCLSAQVLENRSERGGKPKIMLVWGSIHNSLSWALHSLSHEKICRRTSPVIISKMPLHIAKQWHAHVFKRGKAHFYSAFAKGGLTNPVDCLFCKSKILICLLFIYMEL